MITSWSRSAGMHGFGRSVVHGLVLGRQDDLQQFAVVGPAKDGVANSGGWIQHEPSLITCTPWRSNSVLNQPFST